MNSHLFVRTVVEHFSPFLAVGGMFRSEDVQVSSKISRYSGWVLNMSSQLKSGFEPLVFYVSSQFILVRVVMDDIQSTSWLAMRDLQC